MPRYVLLRHDAPTGLHFDFMLERGGVLATWSVEQPPAVGTGQPAARLPDHRLAYLDYEGPISGGRGSVSRWDRGMYSVELWEDDRVEVDIRGEKLAGRATLSRTPEDPAAWRLKLA